MFTQFHENPPVTFWVILFTNRQTNKRTDRQTAVTAVSAATEMRTVTADYGRRPAATRQLRLIFWWRQTVWRWRHECGVELQADDAVMVVAVVDAEERVGPDGDDAGRRRRRRRRQMARVDRERVGRRHLGVRRIDDERVAATARARRRTPAQRRDDRAEDAVVTLCTHTDVTRAPLTSATDSSRRQHHPDCMPSRTFARTVSSELIGFCF